MPRAALLLAWLALLLAPPAFGQQGGGSGSGKRSGDGSGASSGAGAGGSSGEGSGDGPGDDWGDEGGEDSGFADFPVAPPPTEAVAPSSPLALTGTARGDLGAWTERFGAAPSDAPSLPGGNDNPFAKARMSLDLEARYKRGNLRGVLAVHGDHDLALLYRASEYDTATRRAYRHLRDPLVGDLPVQLRDAFVDLSAGDFELTLGRQIVAWGEGDGLSPLDIVNPRDLREPGQADLDDIRVPILASRLGYFRGDQRFEAMVTHESHWGFRSPPLGPFSPFPVLIEENPMAATLGAVDRMRRHDVDFSDEPEGLDPAGWQYLARWLYNGEGIDLGLYAGSVVDRQGIIELDQAALGTLIAKVLSDRPQTIRFPFRHLRYTLVGTSGARAFGNWLLKWELAFEKGHPYNVGSFDSLGSKRADQLDLMLGLTCNGIHDTMIALETSRVVLLDDPGELLFPMDATWLMLRVQHRAMHDRLTLMAVASAIGARAQYGTLGRLDAAYELADGWKLSVGYVTFAPTDEISPLSGLDRHDRALLELRWDFRVL